MQESSLTFLHNYSKHLRIVKEIVPLHDKDYFKSRFDFLRAAAINKKYIDHIKNYFGENIAFYFYFISKLQKWLYIPAVLGLLAHILTQSFHETVATSHFTSFYSLFIIL